MPPIVALLLLAMGAQLLLGLDPKKSLTQYSRSTWSQNDGLPQDGIRAIAQTSDGYLWLGTDAGLARFDGYQFLTFLADHDDLPSDSITALAAAPDGGLWVGTSAGLAHYTNRRFTKYRATDGLPDGAIASVLVAPDGVLWVTAGNRLTRFDGEAIYCCGRANCGRYSRDHHGYGQ